MRSMEFRTFQNQHSGRLPDGTKILFFDNFVEFKLISREKVSDHFVKYWICDRVNQLFSFYICWQCWRTVANSVFTIFQVISGWDQFERRTRTGTTTPTLGESRKTHIHIYICWRSRKHISSPYTWDFLSKQKQRWLFLKTWAVFCKQK